MLKIHLKYLIWNPNSKVLLQNECLVGNKLIIHLNHPLSYVLLISNGGFGDEFNIKLC